MDVAAGHPDEVAMRVDRRRLALSLDVERRLTLLAGLPAVRLLALDTTVAVAAMRLPEPFHSDLADRFLVAQARALAIPLLSADDRSRAYAHGRSLWRAAWLRGHRSRHAGAANSAVLVVVDEDG